MRLWTRIAASILVFFSMLPAFAQNFSISVVYNEGASEIVIDGTHLSEADKEYFNSLNDEEKMTFLRKRELILQGVAAKIVANEASLGYLTWAKGKIVSALKPTTWKNAVIRMVNWQQQGAMVPPVEREKAIQQMARITMTTLIEKVDASLWKQAPLVVRAKEWGFSTGGGVVATAGVYYAVGFGLVLGTIIRQSLDTLEISKMKFIDFQVATRAFFPTLIAAVSSHSFVYISDRELNSHENLKATYYPGGPSSLSGDGVFGLGLSIGVSVPPGIATFAFFKMNTLRVQYEKFSETFIIIRKVGGDLVREIYQKAKTATAETLGFRAPKTCFSIFSL